MFYEIEMKDKGKGIHHTLLELELSTIYYYFNYYCIRGRVNKATVTGYRYRVERGRREGRLRFAFVIRN